MSEYINRESLKERFRKRLNWLKKDIHDEYSSVLYDCCEYDTKLIDEITAADVAPIVHGRWELEYETYGKMRCSVCKKEALIEKAIDDVGVTTIYVDSNYCPNCGAKMDEKEDDND